MGIISTYTRAQAIEDGALVDVTETAKSAGFKFPTVITAALAATCTPPKRNRSGQSYEGRLWDVLWMASCAARTAKEGIAHVTFIVKIGKKNHTLWAIVGPGDQGEGVMTIMHPSDY